MKKRSLHRLIALPLVAAALTWTAQADAAGCGSGSYYQDNTYYNQQQPGYNQQQVPGYPAGNMPGVQPGYQQGYQQQGYQQQGYQQQGYQGQYQQQPGQYNPNYTQGTGYNPNNQSGYSQSTYSQTTATYGGNGSSNNNGNGSSSSSYNNGNGSSSFWNNDRGNGSSGNTSTQQNTYTEQQSQQYQDGMMQMQGGGNILDMIANNSQYSTFNKLLQSSPELMNTLRGNGPFTVFAPTNAAFNKLSSSKLQDLTKPENKDKLRKVLSYHIVSGKYMTSDIKDDLKTLNGDSLNIDVDKDKHTVTIDDAKIVQPNMVASNGVIQGIDTVLMP